MNRLNTLNIEKRLYSINTDFFLKEQTVNNELLNTVGSSIAVISSYFVK